MLSRNFWQKKEGVGIFFFRQKLRDSINISYEKFRFYPTSLTPQNADSPLPPVRQHQQGGSKKKFFFAKSSGISKNSSMRIFVVLRPNLISQSTAWGIRARTKQALFWNLNSATLEICQKINQSSSKILEDPFFWLQKFVREGSISNKNQEDWTKTIQTVISKYQYGLFKMNSVTKFMWQQEKGTQKLSKFWLHLLGILMLHMRMDQLQFLEQKNS